QARDAGSTSAGEREDHAAKTPGSDGQRPSTGGAVAFRRRVGSVRRRRSGNAFAGRPHPSGTIPATDPHSGNLSGDSRRRPACGGGGGGEASSRLGGSERAPPATRTPRG